MYSVKKDNIEHYTRHDITNCEKQTIKTDTLTLHISTTFVIYLHQTIIQTNMGQTGSAQNVKSCLKFDYYCSSFKEKITK